MKEKTNEPKPMVKLTFKEHEGYANDTMEIFILDEGDSMAWNTSTNYDRHMSGPSLVFKRTSPNGRNTTEHFVNDFDQWHYIDKMMRLGKKYIDENPDFDVHEFDKQLKKERAEYEPHVSFHKNK